MISSLVKSFSRLFTGVRSRVGIYDSLGGPMKDEVITEEGAMRLVEYQACLRFISRWMGALPFDVYEIKRGGKVVETKDHPVSWLFSQAPNDFQTAFSYHETTTAHRLGWGNSYSGMEFNSLTDELDRVVPMMPWETEPYLGADGVLRFAHWPSEEVIEPEDVLHVPGFTFDGLVGVSVVTNYCQPIIKQGIYRDKHLERFNRNHVRPSLVVEHPGKLDEESFKNFRQSFYDQIGDENQWKPLIIEGGAKLHSYSMPHDEAQLLESSIFQGKRLAMCLFFCPPSLVGHMADANYNSLEAMDIFFAKHTLTPDLVRVEQAMNQKCFRGRQRGRFFVKFKTDGLERGSLKTRAEALMKLIGGPVMTRNEGRKLFDLEPIEGIGDELITPANITGKQPQKPAGPDSKTEEDGDGT